MSIEMKGVVTGFETRQTVPTLGIDNKSNSRAESLLGYQYKHGTKNPDWRSQVALRQDATTNYVRSIVRLHHEGELLCTSKRKITSKHIETNWARGFYLPTFVTGVDDSSAVLDEANAKVKRKLARERGDEDILTPIAELIELRMTIRSLSDITTKMLNRYIIVLNSLRGASPSSQPGLLRLLPEIWLLYSFAIRPMVSQIADIMGAIDDFKERDFVKTASSTAYQWSGNTTKPGHAYVANMRFVPTVTHNRRLSYRLIAAYRYILSSANDYQLYRDHLHVNVPNMVNALYELTPWSWLVDYFTTLGDCLRDVFQTDVGSPIYAVKNTRKIEHINVSWKWDGTYVASNCYDGKVLSNKDLSYTLISFERSSIEKLPGRVLRFKTWDEIGSHGINKVLNLLSVLILRSRGLRSIGAHL